MNSDFNILLAQMQQDFITDLPERCNQLEDGVLALERATLTRQNTEELFNELYRQIHSLKGSGGIFGVPLISTICHQFESFIGDRRDYFDKVSVEIALQYVDLVRRATTPANNLPIIEHELEQLRLRHARGRATILLVEPSLPMRKLCMAALSTLPLRVINLERGLNALDKLLHEPFDLLIASRSLPDLNALAVVAALRESESVNRNIPVILLSSNLVSIPIYLRINYIIQRNPQLVTTLTQGVTEILGVHR